MIDVLIWYLWAQTFALGGSLVASRWLRNLPDRGYGIGKALGILLGGFAYWILVTVGFSQNNVGAVLLALAAVWVAGVALSVTHESRVTSHESNVRPTASVITTELLFAFGFVAWAVVRAYSPAIIENGGEKFMESMMINAILRSPTFPPNDAWLSGFSISYYYFGYIIYAMLIKVSGVAPSVGFNLGGALIFALTLTSAFSIGFNLWRRNEELRINNGESESRHIFSQFFPRSRLAEESAGSGIGTILNSQFAGLLTAAMLALMGNMGGLMGALKCANALPQPVWQWLDIRDTATQSYTCRGLAPDTFYGWWWDWSRVVKDTDPAGSYQEVITEAPIFSFVLGDNHPHVLALPFVLVALGLALSAYDDKQRATDDDQQSLVISRLPSLILSSIVLGGLSFVNTWDFPVYATLFIGASLLGRWLRREPLLPTLIYGAAVIALGYLIYIPFYATFSSQARGIAVNAFNGTRLSQFVMMFAPFLVAGLGFLLLIARETKLPAVRLAGRTAGLGLGVIVLAIAGALVLSVLSPETRAAAQELQTTGSTFGFTRDQINARLLERVTNPWTMLLLGGGAALCAVLVFSAKRGTAEAPPDTFARGRANYTPSDLFILILFAIGAILTLSVEFVYLRDLFGFGRRMNTIFKFYYIGWALWSVAGGYAVMRLLTTKGALAKVFGGASALLVAAGLLWAVMAIPARTNYFVGQTTLDGMRDVREQHPGDAQMIDWLNKNIIGDAHIIETPALGSYSYQGRISAFTGLPAALGWAGHQQQWRGDITQAAQRNQQVTQFYITADTLEARTLLTDIGARYVIVGDTERGQFPAEGLDKFQTMCATAFQSGNNVIYDCRK